MTRFTAPNDALDRPDQPEEDRATKAFGKPLIEGLYALLPPAVDEPAWLLVRSTKQQEGALKWVAVQDERIIQLAQQGYAYQQQSITLNDPYIRPDTLRQYAVNMMIADFPTIRSVMGEDVSDELAKMIVQDCISRQFEAHRGRECIPFAIANCLEREAEYIEVIEHMLAIAETLPADQQLHAKSVASLLELRRGENPSGGLFSTEDYLEALAKQYPALEHALTCESEYQRKQAALAREAAELKAFEEQFKLENMSHNPAYH